MGILTRSHLFLCARVHPSDNVGHTLGSLLRGQLLGTFSTVCEQLKHFNNPGDAWVTRGLISYSVLVGSAIFSSQLACLSLDSKLQGRTMDQKE